MKSKYGLITLVVITQQYHTKFWIIYVVIESWNLVPQMLIICNGYAEKAWKLGKSNKKEWVS